MADDKRNGEKRKLSLKERSRQTLKIDDLTVIDKKVARKSVFATGIGNAMEWFDFGIYSYLAAVIGKVFFPHMTGSLQLVYSFATFSAAFLVRPFGGIFFGRLGDKIGRKNILAITLILMACSTLSIGFIPSYGTIGMTAPIILLIARLVQGFSTGGEYSGAMTFIAESTSDKQRGFMSSGLEVGTLAGFIGGSGIVTLLTMILGSDTMLQWGWRIPFLIAAPIGVVGFYLRSRLAESPAFEAAEKEQIDEKKQTPMKEILINRRKPLIIGILVVLFYNVAEYTVLTYMPSHLNSVLGYGDTKGLLVLLIVMAIMMPVVLLMGRFADRIGNKMVVQIGLISFILLSVPMFLLIGTGTDGVVFLGVLILGFSLACFQGAMPSLLPSLFFTKYRYGALSITYNVSTSLFGGTAPFVISWLINATGTYMIPAYYLIFVALIGIVVVTFFVKDTSGKPLRGSAPAVREHDVDGAVGHPVEGLWWKDEERQLDAKDSEKNNTNSNP